METTWKAEVDERYYETSLEKIKGSLGTYLVGSPVNLDIIENEEPAEIPENFDSRVEWSKCDSIKEVRD
jgi:hypothetical protein